MSRRDVAGFGPAAKNWNDQFAPLVLPPDPSVDDLKRSHPGSDKDGVELAQDWVRDLSGFAASERRRFRIDELLAQMIGNFPDELWLPSQGAMARSMYSQSELQVIESDTYFDSTALRGKLARIVLAISGKEPEQPAFGLTQFLEVVPGVDNLVEIDLNSRDITDDENQILWFLFGSEMREWLRREVAVQDSVEHERDRRAGEVVGAVADGSMQLLKVAAAVSLLGAAPPLIGAAAPVVTSAYGAAGTAATGAYVSAGTTLTAASQATLAWGSTAATSLYLWAAQNPLTFESLVQTGLTSAEDISKGEFSFWNVLFSVAHIKMARFGDLSLQNFGIGEGGAPAPTTNSNSGLNWAQRAIPSSLRNFLMNSAVGVRLALPATEGTGGGPGVSMPRPVPTMVASAEPGAVGSSVGAPALNFSPAQGPQAVVSQGGATPAIISGASGPTLTAPGWNYAAGNPAFFVPGQLNSAIVPDQGSAPIVSQSNQAPAAAAQVPSATSSAAPAVTPAAPVVAQGQAAGARATSTSTAQVQPQRDAGMNASQNSSVRSLFSGPMTSTANAILGAIWNSVAIPGQAAQLTYANARRLFNNQRNRFWRAVRANPLAVALFQGAGCVFRGSATSAPVLILPNGIELRITIDHIIERQTNWMRALDPANLRFSSWRENVVVLRLLHVLDPFVTQPTDWSPFAGPVDIADIDFDNWNEWDDE